MKQRSGSLWRRGFSVPLTPNLAAITQEGRSVLIRMIWTCECGHQAYHRPMELCKGAHHIYRVEPCPNCKRTMQLMEFSMDELIVEQIGGMTFADNAGGHQALIEFCVATRGGKPGDVIAKMNRFPDLLRSLSASGVDVERVADDLYEMDSKPGRRRR